MTDDRPLPRRRYLAGAGLLGVASLAGCLDESVEGDGPDGDSANRIESNGDDDTEPDCVGPDDDTETTDDTELHADYETTRVDVVTPDGQKRGSVTAAIADTPELRYLGLSETESLPEHRGMLFVFDEADDRRFVMREMDFGIDIVYADSEKTITEIHHAPEPGPDEDGEEQRYPGYGQYVLEVGYEWTADRCVETGDVLEFEL